MRGRTTSSFLPPRDLPSLNAPFCPPPHICGQPAQRCSVQCEAVATARLPQGPVASRRRSRGATASHSDADLAARLSFPKGKLARCFSHQGGPSQRSAREGGWAMALQHLTGIRAPSLERGTWNHFWLRVKPNILKDYSCSVGLIQEGWIPPTHCKAVIITRGRNSSFSKKACMCERGSNKSWQRRNKTSVTLQAGAALGGAWLYHLCW